MNNLQKVSDLDTYLNNGGVKKLITNTLQGKDLTADRFIAAINAKATKDPKVLLCTPESITSSVLFLASVGLLPDTAEGFAYLIPYSNKLEAKISYIGMIELMYRSGNIKVIVADNVYEDDEFDYSSGSENYIKHKRSLKPIAQRGNYIGTYALVKLSSGEDVWTFIDSDEMTKARNAGTSANSPAWTKWADEMRKKVAIKRLVKMLPKTTARDLSIAVDYDNAINTGKVVEITPNEDGKVDYERDVKIKEAVISPEDQQKADSDASLSAMVDAIKVD